MSHPPKDITPQSLYLNRRTFIRGLILASSTAATTLAYRTLNSPSHRLKQPRQSPLASIPATSPIDVSAAYRTTEPQTPFDDITHYNNFYEFSTDKGEVAAASANFNPRPWTIQIAGLVSKPATLDLDDLTRTAPAEERVYRMRCVEGWSMVIPWVGIPLAKILDRAEPLSSAKYVAFQTLLDPARMPGQSSSILNWPYVEGLRMDEAMHPLTLLATGLYGKQLPPQNGAPLRLVIPWKYGFKGIKSIVKITLTDQEPPTSWSAYAPSEYGFYANVNPDVDHPRWSQSTERRLGEYSRRPTLPFNGYADQVAHLYSQMDLRKYF